MSCVGGGAPPAGLSLELAAARWPDSGIREEELRPPPPLPPPLPPPPLPPLDLFGSEDVRACMGCGWMAQRQQHKHAREKMTLWACTQKKLRRSGRDHNCWAPFGFVLGDMHMKIFMNAVAKFSSGDL